MYPDNEATNAASLAMRMQNVYAAQGQAGLAPPIQNQSDGIISRLAGIRVNLTEQCSSAASAADKIVGAAPVPITQAASQLKGGERPPATGFLDAVQQTLCDIERIGSELQDHLNRLHRAF